MTESQTNTLFAYLYRDESNNKQAEVMIFEGTVARDDPRLIRILADNFRFDVDDVDLEPTEYASLDDDMTHEVFEVSPTRQQAVGGSFSEFLDQLIAADDARIAKANSVKQAYRLATGDLTTGRHPLDLSEQVIEVTASLAQRVNKEGTMRQVEYLLENLGPERTVQIITEQREAGL